MTHCTCVCLKQSVERHAHVCCPLFMAYASASHDDRATRTCPFGLRVGLGLSWEAWDDFLDDNIGARVCGEQIGQAAGECRVALIAATSALANDALELAGFAGARAYSLGGADVRTGGGNVSGVARSRVCQHEPAGE